MDASFISISDPQRALEELRGETEAAVLAVLASGQYILGEATSEFEADACRYLRTSHAIGVSSGTDALLLALQALGVGPGDEVVTTSFSFIATATCIARLGARPVFVDIDPDTYQMDPEGLAAAITPRTRAIIAVHLYGHPAPMSRYLSIAGQADEPIAVVEDAAQAIGTVCRLDPETTGGSSELRMAGTIGLWGCFSFYPTKNLPACGEAGLMVTGQPAQAERARQLRNHGQDSGYHHVQLCGNSRLDAIQSAILQIRLAHLERWNENRRQNAALYNRVFTEAGLVDANAGVQLPPAIAAGEVANFHQYTLRASDRDGLQQTLRDQRIGSGVYYPLPLPFQPVFADLGYTEGEFPEAERAAREVLSLPVHQHLKSDEVERVAAAVVAYYRG